MGSVNYALQTLAGLGGGGAVNDTAGALGLVQCGLNENVTVKYAVAFHDFEPGEKLLDME